VEPCCSRCVCLNTIVELVTTVPVVPAFCTVDLQRNLVATYRCFMSVQCRKFLRKNRQLVSCRVSRSSTRSVAFFRWSHTSYLFGVTSRSNIIKYGHRVEEPSSSIVDGRTLPLTKKMMKKNTWFNARIPIVSSSSKEVVDKTIRIEYPLAFHAAAPVCKART
jgi:hypothetical protein